MKKETIADKMAKKAFNSADFQKSWKVHMQAFGPILEPALVENYQARIHLAAALNKISNRDVKGGLEKLRLVKASCVTDADNAAWLFFMGVCFEMAGAKEQMLACYQQAGEFQHRFYLPYLKVAKSAHNDAVFEVAQENYERAIDCFDGVDLDDQSKAILASAYTNLASCLTMMHHYENAEKALDMSARILPQQPGRGAAAAILYAAMGDSEKAEKHLAEVVLQAPVATGETRKLVNEIINGTHPHFYPVQLDSASIYAFWDWFLKNQEMLTSKMRAQEYDSVFATLQSQLKPVFPFLKRDPEIGIQQEEDGYRITFADFYMVSLEQGYTALINACPAELEGHWRFEIAH